MGFPAHQNAAGVNPLCFNNFLFRYIVRLVGKDAHPTAFLFQKLGFAGVSNCKQKSGFINRFYNILNGIKLSGRLKPLQN
ncbi:MAG: hypothetical protein IK065_00075 [Neisseriaceae bacterium]|nr:hypothetical protein [Neisseriaceae bacterium]